MRLSEEMILGSTIRPHSGRHSHDSSRGCALQLANTAVGVGHAVTSASFDRHPWLQNTKGMCPECNQTDTLFGIVALHLNDEHKWSLTSIAEYVASIEPAEVEVFLPVVEIPVKVA